MITDFKFIAFSFYDFKNQLFMKKLFFLLLLCSFASLSIAQPPHLSSGSLTAITSVSTGIFAVPASSSTPSSVVSDVTTPVTAAQWHFAGTNNEINTSVTPAEISEDWIYSLVATKNKEVIAVGYQGLMTHLPLLTGEPF